MRGTLCAVVVHWRDEAGIRPLLDAWPDAEEFPIVVVDNSASLDPSSLPPRVLYQAPASNLGFGGGVDRGIEALQEHGIEWQWVLILNPDATPEPRAVENLLETCCRWRQEDPTTAGVAPVLRNDDGSTQHRWQLQPLPTPWTLVAQIFFMAGQRGPEQNPKEGLVVQQPAAAVLALHRTALDSRGLLFDSGFFPAWFDDVDLARRLHDRGLRLRYTRTAAFEHARGGSVPALGYGRFLWIYYRNLERYLRLHHGGGWTLLTRLSMPISMMMRLALLPVRRPRRAESRRHAAAGLLAVAAGALSGWRLPLSWAKTFTPSEPTSDEIEDAY